jgi:hypothetical protein
MMMLLHRSFRAAATAHCHTQSRKDASHSEETSWSQPPPDSLFSHHPFPRVPDRCERETRTVNARSRAQHGIVGALAINSDESLQLRKGGKMLLIKWSALYRSPPPPPARPPIRA